MIERVIKRIDNSLGNLNPLIDSTLATIRTEPGCRGPVEPD
jgi:hypothetical protein